MAAPNTAIGPNGPPTLSSLPSSINFEVLCRSETLKDLRATIQADPQMYGIFRVYPKQIIHSIIHHRYGIMPSYKPTDDMELLMTRVLGKLQALGDRLQADSGDHKIDNLLVSHAFWPQIISIWSFLQTDATVSSASVGHANNVENPNAWPILITISLWGKRLVENSWFQYRRNITSAGLPSPTEIEASIDVLIGQVVLVLLPDSIPNNSPVSHIRRKTNSLGHNFLAWVVSRCVSDIGDGILALRILSVAIEQAEPRWAYFIWATIRATMVLIDDLPESTLPSPKAFRILFEHFVHQASAEFLAKNCIGDIYTFCMQTESCCHTIMLDQLLSDPSFKVHDFGQGAYSCMYAAQEDQAEIVDKVWKELVHRLFSEEGTPSPSDYTIWATKAGKHLYGQGQKSEKEIQGCLYLKAWDVIRLFQGNTDVPDSQQWGDWRSSIRDWLKLEPEDWELSEEGKLPEGE